MGQLENQTAIIVGAGTGIGFAIAKHFHDEGAFVVFCGRREDVLEQAANNIAPDGVRVLTVSADMTSLEDMQHLAAETVKQTGKIDVLVNSAGAMRVNKPPEQTSLEEWKWVIDTNITGMFLCCREVGKVMIKQNYGRIINITSMSGSIINKYFHGGSYEVSKAAQDMLTKALAIEWAPYNIKVNAIAPGFYGTQPNRDFFLNDPDLTEKIFNAIPVKKLGALEELGRLAVYLASPDIDYMTGSILTIDGGYTIW